MERKNSKELQGIFNAIQKWEKKHKGRVQFIGCFCAFKDDKDFEVIDDRLLAYGFKDTLQMDLDELQKLLRKEKKTELVNW